MKIIFNDASELIVQEVKTNGEYLMVKSINTQPAKLRALFSDVSKTRKMKVLDERGGLVNTYEDYTQFYSTEEYIGGIFGVTNYKLDTSPQAKAEILESSVKVARIQAQSLDDADALEVKNLYPEWRGEGFAYPIGYKVNYEEVLYRCLQEHTSQESWNPKDAASLWTKVLIPDPQLIPEWEQPESTNPYMKGDRVMHTEKIWESLIDGNVWEPGAVGSESLWKEVNE